MIAWIQRYLIIILLAIIAVLFVVAGIQYVRFLKADSIVKEQQQTIKAYDSAIQAWQQTVINAKETEKKQQEIKNMLAKFDKQVISLSKGKCLEVQDEKYFTDLFTVFNDGLLQNSSNTSK